MSSELNLDEEVNKDQEKKMKEAEDLKKKREAEEKKMKEEQKRKMDAKRKRFETPLMVRILNFIIGLVFLIAPAYILLNSDLVIDSAIMIFGVIVILSGISRVINAFYDKNIGGNKRLLRFIIGSVLIIIGLIVIIFPNTGEDTLFMALAVAIALQGVGRLFLGFSHDVFPAWLKITMIILGLTSFLIAVSAFTSLTIGSFTIPQNDIVNLFAASFFIGGISRIGQSLAGLDQQMKK